MDHITGTLSNTTTSITGTLSGGQNLTGTLSRVVTDHGSLTGRDAPEQHPIESIKNLEAELGWRPSYAMSNLEIQEILNS